MHAGEKPAEESGNNNEMLTRPGERRCVILRGIGHKPVRYAAKDASSTRRAQVTRRCANAERCGCLRCRALIPAHLSPFPTPIGPPVFENFQLLLGVMALAVAELVGLVEVMLEIAVAQ